MNKEKIILTDCDGCLLNWNKGFCEFMLTKGYSQKPNTDHEYSIVARHDITHAQAHSFIEEYNHSEYMARLDAYADSKEYVAKLVALGFKFIVVTSLSDDPRAYVNRLENLKMHFGDVFSELHCLKMGESKAAILDEKWGGSNLFWIEDHTRQAEAGHEAGLKTILIDHLYNRDFSTTRFPRVSYDHPWRDIYEMVCKEYGLVEA